MIDLHCHLLPGVDDGSRTVEQSIEVLTRMALEGVTDIVLTPHLEASRILEGPPPAHDEAFATLVTTAPRSIRLHRGAEVMLDKALTPRAISTRRISLAGGRYILVEFTRLVAGRSVSAAVEELIRSGLVPLIAHPERYSACTPAMVAHWRALGALAQIDANTLFEGTSRGRRARALVADGLGDVLAADNHGDKRSLAIPWGRLVDAGFKDEAQLLMRDNPAAIVADKQCDVVPPVEIPVSLLSRLKGWLREVQE